MPIRVANRVFWLLITVSALMLVVGIPLLQAMSKAAVTKAYVQQDRVLDDRVEDGSTALGASASADELQSKLSAAWIGEAHGQFLLSAATLAVAAGAILAIAFYVRYQISATDEASSG